MKVVFLNLGFKLNPSDIPKLRGAITSYFGLGCYLFQNHENAASASQEKHNNYPLILYSVSKGYAQISGIGEGADAILNHLIPTLPDKLFIGNKMYRTLGWKMKIIEWDINTHEIRQFGVFKWIALNSEKYKLWKAEEGNDNVRHMILSNCLTVHLRNFAALYFDPSSIYASVLKINGTNTVKWKNTKFVSFNAICESNFVPLTGLHIGKCRSFGFGEICNESDCKNLI